MKKDKVKKLLKLIKQQTKAEAIARHGPCNDLGFAEARVKAIKKQDEIRKLLYGTSNLAQLGADWGLFLVREDQKQKYKKRKRKNYD